MSTKKGVTMVERIEGAILQRDKETYAIVPRIPMGVLTPEILESLAKVARRYNVRIIKITSGQRIALVGLKPEDVESAWKDLAMEVGPAEGLCVHYVQACPGTETCKFGQGDSLGLASKLEKLYVGKKDYIPAKTKFGISGCRLTSGSSIMQMEGKPGLWRRVTSQRNRNVPSESWCGSPNVARSMMVSGLKIVISA